MAHDAREIANFFLDYADRQDQQLTIMALLKLIYFAHGWRLAIYGQPLVKNHFEAWKHGPVVRAVYESFERSGGTPLTSRANKFDPVEGSQREATYNLSEEETVFLAQIFGSYGHLHAYRLSEVTHERGSPWDEVWQEDDPETINPGMRISNERIRNHFLSKKERTFSH